MSEFPAYIAYGHDHSRNEEYTPGVAAGEQMLVGEFVVWDDSNNWIERAGADPTLIVGISEVLSEAARLLTPDGKIPIRRLLPGAVIALSCATLLDIATHLNQEYGITRSSGGKWQLDPAKTTTSARCKVIRIGNLGSLSTQIAYVEFLQEFLDDTIDS